ncbi:MAG: hypothetical protein V1854_03690 [Methanobacteriota archaeon]
MILFKPSPDWDGDVPLTWRNYIGQDGRILECSPVTVDPNAHYLSIHKHTILGDGTVQPSVGCPVGGCGFHEFIKLESWMNCSKECNTCTQTCCLDPSYLHSEGYKKLK